MLFNSYIFIFLFFPIVICGYFFLNRINQFSCATLFLIASSLFFYGYWNPIYLPLILISILGNYYIGLLISLNKLKYLLICGIFFNLCLLGFYKYSDFLISNFNIIFNTNFSLMHITLPLGISFFTFTQIAFLVDTYKNKVTEFKIINYALFVVYFPHLLAGPLLHHSQMIPQFVDKKKRTLDYKNLTIGLCIFVIGLFKKTCIADTLAEWVGYGYASINFLTAIEAWLLTFCYSLQLYFDFSGYSDMAIGCSLMMNIKLPDNFNSPYRALNIKEFWQRWHITLSHWLKEYIYIPLGGNRHSEFRTSYNLLITFLVGGFWHGAGWTFIIWGAMHGFAVTLHRLYKQYGNDRMPKWLAWFLTFFFVNFAWIFFRSDSIEQASGLIKKMFRPIQIEFPISLTKLFYEHSLIHLTLDHRTFLLLLTFFTYVVYAKTNSMALRSKFNATVSWNVFISSVFAFGILSLNRAITFIYFQF